jgi:LytS/YehU family sensor histidine kinase
LQAGLLEIPNHRYAVRHGVDPSETGGHIDIDVSMHSGRCVARVTDTGIGLQAAGHGLGTGLVILRERLQLAFGNDAELSLSDVLPRRRYRLIGNDGSIQPWQREASGASN